jgi:hypothetical protein
MTVVKTDLRWRPSYFRSSLDSADKFWNVIRPIFLSGQKERGRNCIASAENRHQGTVREYRAIVDLAKAGIPSKDGCPSAVENLLVSKQGRRK